MAKRKATAALELQPLSARKLKKTRGSLRSGTAAEESVYFERGRAGSPSLKEDALPTTSDSSCAPQTSSRKLASLKSASVCTLAEDPRADAAGCTSSYPTKVPGKSARSRKFVAPARTPKVVLHPLDDDVVRASGTRISDRSNTRLKVESDPAHVEHSTALPEKHAEKSGIDPVDSRAVTRKPSSNTATARKRSAKAVADGIVPGCGSATKSIEGIVGNKFSASSSSQAMGSDSNKSKNTKKLVCKTSGRRPAGSGPSPGAIRKREPKKTSDAQLTEHLERKIAKALTDDSGSDEASTDDEWEEVEELMGEDQMIKSQLPSKPVEVLLDVPDIPGLSKRKKKTFDVHAYLRKKWRKFKKEQHENVHKVHLLCYLSYGMQLNRICNQPLLQSAALSICTREGLLTGDITVSTLVSRVQWFNLRVNSSTTTATEACVSVEHLESELMADMSKRSSTSSVRHALIFLLLLRACGVASRLVLSVHPIPWKIADLRKESLSESPACQPACVLPDLPETVQKGKSVRGKAKKANAATSAGNSCPATKASKAAGTKPDAACKVAVEGSDSSHKNRTPRRSCAAVKSYYEKTEELTDSDEEDNAAGSFMVDQSTTGRKTTEHERETDDDFTSKPVDMTSCKAAKKSRVPVRGAESVQLWLEVYVDKPGKWICLDVAEEVLDTAANFEARSSRPFTYVIAYDNDGCIKDVTQRYASAWMSATQKVRVDQEWWCETLATYKTCNLARDQAEDTQMLRLLEKRPFPTSVAEFKGHPLYALKRHLLKFEAIYPESAVPLGYIKGEAIYARECVHTLHSRETWLKHAKSIRIGEQPYKMVKPRPKMNKPDDSKGEATLGVFGSWQVEDFQPPVAIAGKVPRNEYGNVELFKPCMIPIGCVHLPIPGLHRVAKKLNIDVAPAMVGWEGYCGYSVPQFDGWVVCEEYKDTLLAAWEEYEAEERRKQAEKKEKRVLANWTLLVRGLLIKEKLKGRFNLTDSKETLSAEGEAANDADKAWPQNMTSAAGDSALGSCAALFPFEQM